MAISNIPYPPHKWNTSIPCMRWFYTSTGVMERRQPVICVLPVPLFSLQYSILCREMEYLTFYHICVQKLVRIYHRRLFLWNYALSPSLACSKISRSRSFSLTLKRCTFWAETGQIHGSYFALILALLGSQGRSYPGSQSTIRQFRVSQKLCAMMRRSFWILRLLKYKCGQAETEPP